MILSVLVILFAQFLLEKVSSSGTLKLPGYDFSYNVFNAGWHQDFGHSERRQQDFTEGEYYVLLPDGRKQVVKYYADERGYFPTITYRQDNLDTVSPRLNNYRKSDSRKGGTVSFNNLPLKTKDINSLSLANKDTLDIISRSLHSLPTIKTRGENLEEVSQAQMNGEKRLKTSHFITPNILLQLPGNYNANREPTALFLQTQPKYSHQESSKHSVNINKGVPNLNNVVDEVILPKEVPVLEKEIYFYSENSARSKNHFRENFQQNVDKNILHKQFFIFPSQNQNKNNFLRKENKDFKNLERNRIKNYDTFREDTNYNLNRLKNSYKSQKRLKPTDSENYTDQDILFKASTSNLKNAQEKFIPSLRIQATSLVTKKKSNFPWSTTPSEVPIQPAAKLLPPPPSNQRPIPKHNSNGNLPNSYPHLHPLTRSNLGSITPPPSRNSKGIPDITLNTIPSFFDMNINPDDSVVPRIVPVIIPVEGNLDNSIFRDFEFYDRKEYGGAVTSFVDYFDDEYL